MKYYLEENRSNYNSNLTDMQEHVNCLNFNLGNTNQHSMQINEKLPLNAFLIEELQKSNQLHLGKDNFFSNKKILHPKKMDQISEINKLQSIKDN